MGQLILVSLYSRRPLVGARPFLLRPNVLPQFPEGVKSSWAGYNFVTCNDIKVALARLAGSNATLAVPAFRSSALIGAYLAVMCGSTSPVGCV